MYRRNNSRSNLSVVILFGVIAGIAFLIYDNWGTIMSTPATATPEAEVVQSLSQDAGPTGQAVSMQENAAASPTQTVPPINASIVIPAAGVNSRIIPVFLNGETWDVTNLGTQVGHLQGTPWLDAPGNIVLSGHVELSDGRRGVFAALKDLQEQDIIIIEYNGVERRYIVTEIRNVQPDDLSPLMPSNGDRLTLITCDVYDFWSDSYLERTVVVAERIS